MAQSFAPFYRGKRVLVTGHTGFTGGWLVAWLKLLGAKVCGYGLPPSSRPNFFDATLLDRGITSVFADLRDRDTLGNTLADFQPEIIFHAAAWQELGGSSNDPMEVFGVNVVGALNLLEEARLTGCARAIVLLSDLSIATHIFDQKDSEATSAWLPATHDVAQGAASAFAASWFRDSRTRVATARLPSLIGGGDWAEARLVPALLRSLTSSSPILIRDCSVVSDFSHVLEASRASLHLAENLYASGPAAAGAWDFCPPDTESISQTALVQRIVECWGVRKVEIGLHSTPITPPNHFLIPTPAKQYPGWTPALTLDEAIAWTVDWCKAHLSDPSSAWRTTEAQIEQYAKLPVRQSVIPAGQPEF